MSAALRDAARNLIRDVELEIGRHGIDPDTPIGKLRQALHEEDLRLNDLEPAVVHERDAQIAVLLEALRRYEKGGGHFIGCTGDKTGRCNEACILARGAFSRGPLQVEASTIGRLQREITGLKRDWRAIRARLRDQQTIHRRMLQTIEAETGFRMRKPGRPRNPVGDVHSAVVAGTTGCPGL